MNNVDHIAVTPSLQAPSTRPSGGLRTPGLLGRSPQIGLMLVLLGIAIFAFLAISLQTHGATVQLDSQIDDNIHTLALQSSPIVVDIMIFGFYLGEQVIVGIGAILVVYFLLKRFWAELSMIIIAWGGEGGIWLVLAQYFNRTRPHFDKPVWHLMTAPGFPSGHSFASLMCFGLLAYLLIPKMPSRAWKIIVIVIAIMLTLYVGFSRIFVGDHYPTDVLAGYALGIAWSGLVYTSVEIISQRRQKGQEIAHPQQKVAKI